MSDHIPASDCNHGYLYRIHSRNLLFGVYNVSVNGFVGIREKFGDNYLFTEVHCDSGGTVRPLEELEFCPVTDLREYFSLCASCHKPHVTIMSDENPPKVADRRHFDDTPLCEYKFNSGAFGNKVLFNWLETKERDYQGG